ncbi:MAG: hypothetical protein KJZ80_07965 [Hyphomicrobiaceae bacterium]|nr:hypothetical protein [Hyphomicrobiaceae bacterium]
MWSPRGQEFSASRCYRGHQALRSIAFIAILATLLAACEGGAGFRPMYGSAAVANTSEKLASVSFGTIPGRVGQRLRNELIFQGTGGGYPAQPEYQFDVAIREQLVSTLVDKKGNAQSQVYKLEAKFQLIRLTDKKVVLEGTSYSRAGFERYTSIFSNVQARDDAEDRAARTVAQDIRSRLSAYLSGAA